MRVQRSSTNKKSSSKSEQKSKLEVSRHHMPYTTEKKIELTSKKENINQERLRCLVEIHARAIRGILISDISGEKTELIIRK